MTDTIKLAKEAGAQQSDYHLFTVLRGSYSPHLSFKAQTPVQAAQRHVTEWGKKPTAFALVMLDEDGIWHSYEDSAAAIRSAASTNSTPDSSAGER